MHDTVEHSMDRASLVFQTSRRRFLGWIGAGIAALCIPRPLWATESSPSAYRETIAVLAMLYRGEVESHRRYKAFEQQALKDGHANIAHLFAATANSESIHAKRFCEILTGLGAPPADVEQTHFDVGSTKENLKFATDVELAEIDVHYPEYLARIRAENHTKAIKYITYSWKAEQQHRELIKDIRSGTGIFFGMLAEQFRNSPVRYFVCQNCGSTLTAMPKEKCPVCTFPVSWYKEIKLPAVIS